MKKSVALRIEVIIMVVLASLMFFPVAGMVYPPPTSFSSAANISSPVAGATNVTATQSEKQFVGARISSGTPAAGDLVTINGIVTGGILPDEVRIWVFAGNSVNVSLVTVNADGTFSMTYSTNGLPLATYYVYIQSPGANGKFNIDFEESGVYSGQVVNTQTNALIFNFTGTGGVQDAAASRALSDAINNQGVDDAYTKLTFQLGSPNTTPVAELTTAPIPGTSSTPTAKSPLALEITGLALVIGGTGAVMCGRKRG